MEDQKMIVGKLLVGVAMLSPAMAQAGQWATPDLERIVDMAITSLEKENLAHFKTKKIECSRFVWDYARKEQALYLDFEGDCGYLLLSPRFGIRGFSDSVDYPRVRNDKESVIFVDNGFATIDSLGQITFLSERKESDPNYVYKDNLSVSGSPIEYGSLLTYLDTKYDATFVLGSAGRLSSLPTSATSGWYNQQDESVFEQSNGASEGNCGLVSISNVLAFYSRFAGKANLPSYTSTTSFLVYSNITLVQQAAQFSPPYYVRSAYATLHQIYERARAYAISQGYVCSGMDDNKTSYSYVNTCSYYGYQGTFNAVYSPSSLDVAAEIDSNRPIQFRTEDDMYYHGHGMMGTGYRQYWATKQLTGGMYVEFDIFCVSVVDGYSSTERWYDVDLWCSYDLGGNRAQSVSIAKLGIQ